MSIRIYGNRPLKTLPGLETRPTSSRVRTAVFNIWQGSVVECHWLDLCAGSGTMGAEALARGAATVTGIELSSRACGVIRENWGMIARPDQKFRLYRGELFTQLKRLRNEKFGRIYFDPPYGAGLYQRALQYVSDRQILASDGELAAEYDPKRWSPVTVGSLEPIRHKTYGNTAIAFYGWTSLP
ncbi:MAG: 16S rRNA (guanine(966)-N(2))-methyltransferase RsmD [Cyanobacteria bacterium P01_C01_bin.89]